MALVLSFLSMISCDNKSVEPTDLSSDSNLALSASDDFAHLKISVPDTVPGRVNDLAAARALELDCDGLRILTVETEQGIIKYHIQIFSHSMDNIIDECFLTPDGQFEEIPPSCSLLIEQKWQEKHAHLKKTATTWCVPLAEFFVDASYGGNYFRVTQLANYTTGYFHKLINCLAWSSCLSQCSSPTFPGGFNDCISSHDWDSAAYVSLYTYPDLIRVYDFINRTDLKHTFSGGAQFGDGNWGDNGCNDVASSLRLQYYIRSY